MKILRLDLDGNVLDTWNSPSEAANELDLDASHIMKVVKGKRKTHGGYYWKVDEQETMVDQTFSKSYDYKKDEAILTAKTDRPLTSLEEALEFFEVDTEKWEAERYVINSWDVTNKYGQKYTNYQVKVWLKPKDQKLAAFVASVDQIIEARKPKSLFHTSCQEERKMVINLSDFHIGADVKDLPRTQNYGLDIIRDYIASCVEIINAYEASEIYVNLHGDFFESISGMNKENTFKSSNVWGADVIILANQLIGGDLLSNIINLKGVNIVGGNHDRMSPSHNLESTGEGAKLLSYILSKDFPGLDIEFNSLIISKEIDGINYIMTHGDKYLNRKDTSKIVMDYGNSSMFNLLTEGHFHSRYVKKTYKTSTIRYDEYETVTLDAQKYRKITLPSLFTGNYYSEAMGFGGTAGMIITENNGKGFPLVYDYTL